MANIASPSKLIRLGMTGQEGLNHIAEFDTQILASATYSVMLHVSCDRWNKTEFKAKFGVDKPELTPPELEAKASPAAAAIYTTNKLAYEKVQTTIHELKQKFLQKMTPADQDLLKIQGDDRILAAYSLRELVESFRAKFGQIHQHERQQMLHSLAHPSTATTINTLPAFMRDFNKTVITLHTIGRAVSDGDQIDAFITGLGGASGEFHNAILNFTQKPEGARTIANLQQDAQADALRRLALPQSATAQTTGFANAASTAQATPPGPANAGTGGGRGGHQGRGGPHQHNRRGGGPRTANPTKDGGQITTGRIRYDHATGAALSIKIDDHYCWSHGPHGANCGFTPHASSACQHKMPGHQDAATFDDIKGGRTIFCHHDKYARFPHV